MQMLQTKDNDLTKYIMLIPFCFLLVKSKQQILSNKTKNNNQQKTPFVTKYKKISTIQNKQKRKKNKTK